MSTQFNLEIVALIHQHYPYAFKGDAQQIAEVSCELATALGGLLVFAYRFGGDQDATRLVNLMIDKIISNAATIDKKTAEIKKAGMSIPVGN
jgi:hypothetical protein